MTSADHTKTETNPGISHAIQIIEQLGTAVHPALSASCTTMFGRLLAHPERQSVVNDLTFLEAWQDHPVPGSAAAMRIRQILRANPELPACIREIALRDDLAPGAPPVSAG